MEAMSREKGIVERMETLERMAALDDLVLEFYEINSLLGMTKTAVTDGCSDMYPDALSKALHRLHRDLTSTICKLIEIIS